MKCEGIVRLLLLLAAGSPVVALAQNKVSVAERLGFGSDAKLLIVHAGDVGMTHAVNAATIKALESGGGGPPSALGGGPRVCGAAGNAKTPPAGEFLADLHLASRTQ